MRMNACRGCPVKVGSGVASLLVIALFALTPAYTTIASDESANQSMETAESLYAKGLAEISGALGTKNPSVGYSYLERAALLGSNEAAYLLGLMKMNGDGTSRSIPEGLRWMHLSANYGNPDAQFFLGNAYRDGLHLNTNIENAFRYYLSAATAGHREAQSSLGLFYMDGIVVPRDPGEAYYWFEKAAAQGDPDGLFHLGYFAENGILGNKNLKIALELYGKSAEGGNGFAACKIGMMLHEGRGVTRNDMQSYSWLLIGLDRIPKEQKTDIANLRDEIRKKITLEESRIASTLARRWEEKHWSNNKSKENTLAMKE